MRNLQTVLLLTGIALVTQHCTPDQDSAADVSETVFHVTEEVRIGTLEGEEEYVFGAVADVTAGSNGEIIIVDRQVSVIRVFDENGAFLRNIGREGQGPGEYLAIGGIKIMADGRFAVWDPRNIRIMVYEQTGEYIKDHFVNSPLFSSSLTFQTGPAGDYFVKTLLRNSPDFPNGKFAWLKVSPEGEVVDTIRIPLDEEIREQAFVVYTASGSAYPFNEWPLSTMSPLGYLITGRNDEYAFELHQTEADPIQVERDFTPVHLKTEEKNEWEAWKRYYDTNNVIPDTKPAYKQIFTDLQGRIWIWRYVEAEYTEKNIGPHFGPESRWWERPTYDVFMPDGSFYATVVLPWNANFREAMDEYVWAVVRGEHDEQYVSRFRLKKNHELVNMDLYSLNEFLHAP